MFDPAARLRARPPPPVPRPNCTSNAPCHRPRPPRRFAGAPLREKAAVFADDAILGELFVSEVLFQMHARCECKCINFE